MIKTYIIKIQSQNLIQDNGLLAMIPKDEDPWQDHPVKNDPSLGSNFLSLNREILGQYLHKNFSACLALKLDS